ncbi:Ger(x)C family spore germination protein [Paenibacillus daejeonensis]|uniref:Ger(x)C family spore germination protein n=1 Tax=Paenibacillus daejeonensis TaxID=135193 RepID=UPI000377F1CC|nr:Ger(x)C family spore germination protein [Paenibacillus daejeonensis]
MARCIRMLLLSCLMTLLLTSCWSSQEIENLALYSGLALDVGEPAPIEKEFEAKGATYPKQNKVMATVQIVPVKTIGTNSQKQQDQKKPYINISGSGDSILEIFRQFSIRLDQPIIGHHLKVIVVSAELLKQQPIGNVMDFLLRDNDIRPSTMVFVSQGSAKATMESNIASEVPSFHIMGMLRNRSRTSKVLKPVTLSRLDSLIYSERSFMLQNLVTGGEEVELSGAGIIKGSSGKWIGTLNQTDTQCLAWIRNEGTAGTIKVNEGNNNVITYELEDMKSKVTPKVDGDDISFHVELSTEGRIIEVWNDQAPSSSHLNEEEVSQLIKKQLKDMTEESIRKLQKKYQTDVAGFGNRLAIKYPSVWRKVKDRWDEVFSDSEVTFSYELQITDFGSFIED